MITITATHVAIWLWFVGAINAWSIGRYLVDKVPAAKEFQRYAPTEFPYFGVAILTIFSVLWPIVYTAVIAAWIGRNLRIR